MRQVQLRLPEQLLREIDKWIEEGRYKSRSDAIRIILAIHQEREKTREFYEMLNKRSHESKAMPDILIPFTD